MGLDIHAASHLKYLRPMPEMDELDRLDEEIVAQGKCLDDFYFLVSPNESDWEEHLAGMEPGMYECTPRTEQHSFRAGPYSGYNWWREQLCRFALGVKPGSVWSQPKRFA